MSPAKHLARFLPETPQEIGKFQIELCTKFSQQHKKQRKPDPLWQTLTFESECREKLPGNFVQNFQFGRLHHLAPSFDSTTRGWSGLSTVIFPFARNRQPNDGSSLEI